MAGKKGKREFTIHRMIPEDRPNVAVFDAKLPERSDLKLECDVSQLSDAIKLRTTIAGVFQTVGDCAALEKNADGSAPTPEQKFAAMRERWTFLLTGVSWEAKRETLTPEQKAENTRRTVLEAWISLQPAGAGEVEFTAYVEKTAARTNSALNLKPGSDVTPAMVIADMETRADIAGAIVAIRKQKTPAKVQISYADI